MKINTGMRLKSAVCSTEAVVIKAPESGENMLCGTVPMLPMADDKPDLAQLTEPQSGHALIGKRYVDEESGLELLCTKQGLGALEFEGRTLSLKQPKPLPSSD